MQLSIRYAILIAAGTLLIMGIYVQLVAADMATSSDSVASTTESIGSTATDASSSPVDLSIDLNLSSTTATSTLADAIATTSTNVPDGILATTTADDATSTVADATSTSPKVISLPVAEPAAIIPTSSASTTKITVACTMSYVADLFDTPSGHLDDGYMNADDASSTATTTTGKIAHKIGTQAWTVCSDGHSKRYELKVTPDDYSRYGGRNAVIPEQQINVDVDTASSSGTKGLETIDGHPHLLDY